MKSERGLIQRKLYISLFVIIAITLVVSISFYIISTKNYRSRIISEYINEKSLQAVTHFSTKEKLINSNLQLLTKWGQNGLINLSDTGNIDRVFIPLIEDAKDIYAISLFEELGNEYEIRKDNGGYLSRRYKVNEKNPEIAFKWKKTDKNGNEIGHWNSLVTDKPSENIFSEPVNKDSLGISWYEPYFSERLNKNVMSISASWSKNNKVYHIVLHILLKDIFEFINIIELKKNEYAFLASADGDVYNFYEKNNTQYNDYERINDFSTPYYKVKLPTISKAVNLWLNENKNTKTSLQFRLNKVSYWSKFEYLNKSHNKYVLGIVVSEDSFSAKIGEGKFLTLIVSFLFVFAGIIIALFFTLRYNRILRRIPKPKINIKFFERDVRALSNLPESIALEFKSTVRFNLKAEKNDKAIEQAWLKSVAAFLNTDGGVLLIGVDDGGGFCGIEKDNFENLDKASLHIKNLITKYIGVEYMKFVVINSGFITQKPIIAIACKQATKPAYIKLANEELFYIRIGPSSTKLTISQAVEHISNHAYKQLS